MGAGAWDEAMSDSSIILFSGMIQPLRLARVCGYLVQRSDGVYRPGGNRPACTTPLALRMVEGGWLARYGDRYEPTQQGLRAAE